MSVVRGCGSVLLVGANGMALFETRRLCAEDLRVDIDDTHASDRIAILRYVGAQHGRAMALTSSLPLTTAGERDPCARHPIYPTITIAFDEAARWRQSPVRESEHFNLLRARERLAMLARLATLCKQLLSYGPMDIAAVEYKVLHAQVAAIQHAFGVHRSEADLCDRVGIDPATLRRWFSSVGALTPTRTMCWVRLHEFALRLALSDCSIERAVSEMGFSSPSNVRRALRRLTGLSSKSLRHRAGYLKFVALMSDEFCK